MQISGDVSILTPVAQRALQLDEGHLVRGQIYVITNKVNGLKYVGQTRTHVQQHGRLRPAGYLVRWGKHVSAAKCGSKKASTTAIVDAITVHGADNFRVELVEECDVAQLDEREIFHINALQSLTPHGYNINSGGGVGVQRHARADNNTEVLTKKRERSWEGVHALEATVCYHSQPTPKFLVKIKEYENQKPADMKTSTFSAAMEGVEKTRQRALEFAARHADKVVIGDDDPHTVKRRKLADNLGDTVVVCHVRLGTIRQGDQRRQLVRVRLETSADGAKAVTQFYPLVDETDTFAAHARAIAFCHDSHPNAKVMDHCAQDRLPLLFVPEDAKLPTGGAAPGAHGRRDNKRPKIDKPDENRDAAAKEME